MTFSENMIWTEIRLFRKRGWLQFGSNFALPRLRCTSAPNAVDNIGEPLRWPDTAAELADGTNVDQPGAGPEEAEGIRPPNTFNGLFGGGGEIAQPKFAGDLFCFQVFEMFHLTFFEPGNSVGP